MNEPTHPTGDPVVDEVLEAFRGTEQQSLGERAEDAVEEADAAAAELDRAAAEAPR